MNHSENTILSSLVRQIENINETIFNMRLALSSSEERIKGLIEVVEALKPEKPKISPKEIDYKLALEKIANTRPYLASADAVNVAEAILNKWENR